MGVHKYLSLTWPPLLVEKMRSIPPHCLTYHINHNNEAS